MKRLVTQFDDKRTRATVATPTCCCCCCCVASFVTTETVTVLNTLELLDRAPKPVTMRSSTSRTAGAFFALPLAVLGGIAAGLLFSFVHRDGAAAVGLIAGMAAWCALLALTYRNLGLARRAGVIAVTIVVGTALFYVEAWVGFMIFASDSVADPGWVYVGFVVLVPLLAVPLLRGLMVILMRPARS